MVDQTHRELKMAPIFAPLLADHRYKGAVGGRNGAKSWFFAEMLIEMHIAEPFDSVCLREIQKSLQFSSKKLLEATIARLNAGMYFEVQDKVIKVRSAAHGGLVEDGIIIFQGMQDHTADSIKSLEGFRVAWFEEAQNASEHSLKILRPTIRLPNSQLWFSWNRFKPDDAIEILLCGKNRPDDCVVVEANMDDNPFINDAMIAERETDRKLYDEDTFNHVWYGKYLKNTQGDYYKAELAKVRATGRICRIPELEHVPVNTFWDIGNGSGTACWFHQTVGMEDRFIGYMEGHDETLGYYAKELQDRGFIFNKHFFPHDAAHKRLSDTNKSIKEMMEDLGLRNIEIVPQITTLNTGIQITKAQFPTAYFDIDQYAETDPDNANGCALGMKRLDNYRKRYNHTDKRWIDEPDKKNGCSEAADAFRQWAQAKANGQITLAGEHRAQITEKRTGLEVVMALTPLMEYRRARVLKMLDAAPDVKRAIFTDTDSDKKNVIVAVAIRGVGNCELAILKLKYDPWKLLDLVEKHGVLGK